MNSADSKSLFDVAYDALRDAYAVSREGTAVERVLERALNRIHDMSRVSQPVETSSTKEVGWDAGSNPAARLLPGQFVDYADGAGLLPQNPPHVACNLCGGTRGGHRPECSRA